MTLPDGTLIEFDGSGNPHYLGRAAPGSLTADPVWQIRRFTFTANSPTAILYANSSPEFSAVWDNRASLPYG